MSNRSVQRVDESEIEDLASSGLITSDFKRRLLINLEEGSTIMLITDGDKIVGADMLPDRVAAKKYGKERVYGPRWPEPAPKPKRKRS